jgi:hypothetical protein
LAFKATNMGRKYLAFDIETAKDVPGEEFIWRPHRPLGISCAATLASGSNQPRRWYGRSTDGTPAKQMSVEDTAHLVRFLTQMASDGFTILTWNGLGFDFDVIAEESQLKPECTSIALGHVDMMFHLVCTLGYPVSLQRAAEGMGIPGKPAGMTGIKAPKAWAEGQHQEVLDYVCQDVRIALQIAQAAEQLRQFQWITQRGSKKSIPLLAGWLTVQDAMRLPEPDTSWMAKPLLRREFSGWLTGK